MKIIEQSYSMPNGKENRLKCTFTMDAGLVRKLNRYKKQKGLSKSRLISDLLNNYLEGRIK